MRVVRFFAVAAIVGSMSVAVPAAGAATRRIRCATLSGTPSDGLAFGLCTGHTGGRTTVYDGFLNGPYTITWANGKTTSVNDSIRMLRPDGCPTGWTTEYRLRGQVTADTTGSTTVGNTVRALLCSNNNLQVMLLPGTNLSI